MRFPTEPTATNPLTPAQRTLLVRYNQFRNQPPDLLALLRPMLPRVGLLVALIAVSAVFSTIPVTCFVAGMAVGSILKQVGLSVQTLRVLPVLLAVIDWTRVAQLLGASAPLTDRDPRA